MSLAVAATSFLAAGLFIVVDAARSVLGPTAIHQVVGQTQMVGAAAMVAAGTAPTARAVSAAAAAPPGSGEVVGIMQRGAGAFGLALLVTGLAWRRRPLANTPQMERDAHPAPRDLIATMPFGIAYWSASGELLDCNAEFRAHLRDEAGIAPGAIYRSAITSLAQGGYMTLMREDNEARLLELHRSDGSCLLVEERPLQLGGFVTLVTDITERRRTDEMLISVREEQRQLARQYHTEKLRAEAASRSKTAFLAHLSHDIRTPLNHIIGFAELMRHQTYGPIGDQRYLTYVETIKGSGERLLAFFASILELAELESGQRDLRELPLEVDELLEATARKFRAQASRAGLTLGVGPQTGAMVVGDRFCLERMLGNLVENSLRFTPTGGKVTLAAYVASDGVVLEVADTGIGMSETRLSELSQPFAFGDATFTREHSGSTLGLPIARAIAEQSGGRLGIDSRPGLGTTVAISLPMRPAGVQERAA